MTEQTPHQQILDLCSRLSDDDKRELSSILLSSIEQSAAEAKDQTNSWTGAHAFSPERLARDDMIRRAQEYKADSYNGKASRHRKRRRNPSW